MKFDWRKRLIVAVKAKLGLKVVDSDNQKYVYRRNMGVACLTGSEEHTTKKRIGPLNVAWWNHVLNSKELTFRCISGLMDAKPTPPVANRPDQSVAFEGRGFSSQEAVQRPARDKKKHNELIRESRPAASYAPPKSPDKRRNVGKSWMQSLRKTDSPPHERDSGSPYHREKQEKPFTEKEYLQILEEQNKKLGKQAPVSLDRPLLPPHFIQAVDMLITQMNLSRNEFSERSLLDVKIYDRIKRKENWNPKADTCKAILFALRPNVITALQLYHLAGYTFRECDEDLLLLCMFGVGDYDIETYNSVMVSRGLRELGSKSKK